MRRVSIRSAAAAALLALLVAGCATRTRAPVDDRAIRVPPPPTGQIQPPMPSTPLPPPPPQPPAASQPDWRPELYTVKRGDTLYQIALEHGLDYRELAAMNNIENLNVIRPGQVLRLRPATDVAMTGPGTADRPVPVEPRVGDARPESTPRPMPRTGGDIVKTGPKAIRLPYSDAAFAQLSASGRELAASAGTPVRDGAPAPMPPAAAPAGPAGATGPIPPLASAAPTLPPSPATPASPAVPPAAASATAPPDMGEDRVEFAWPVRGKLLSGYSETASLKGIDIGGTSGVPILASAPGKVVYAGSGLRGYGKLVIVKHNKTYLSAYAHLDQIGVKEGQMVGKGQELGKMGRTDADQVKLHFEIRSLGKPVDPLRYLPKG